MTESAGVRAELYWGVGDWEVVPDTRIENVSRFDIADAVNAVKVHGEGTGAVRVEDCLDDQDSLATMCEAKLSDGVWELSYYSGGTFILEGVPPEKVVEVLWLFATADPAFRDVGWKKYSDRFPFSMMTPDLTEDIPAAAVDVARAGGRSAVPGTFREFLEREGVEVSFDDLRSIDAPSLTVASSGGGFELTLLGGGRRTLVVDSLDATEQVVASWLLDDLQPPVQSWN